MCPTPLGRTQTRTAILVGPAILGLILSLITSNEGYIVLIGIYLVMGVVLDILFYPVVIKWQPPWLTFLLAVGEFVILYVLSQVLKVGLEPWQAIVFYWVCWIMANWSKIVILPLFELTWIESGGEFRTTGWSTPAEHELIPVLATIDADPSGGRLVREFSSVNKVPQELLNLPAPSGVHRVPQRQS
ncbi:MAG: hypothetical protein QOJ35_3520 [Solirubrobacteraceae bacterium]|jgi:hypothetical protein|nr:hypothetical protein [Solirubrobacteraceae bacterium]